VEELRDRLGKHAAELEKLLGRKRERKVGEENEYETSEEDDSDLEFEI
jgi:hypothetical protein